MYANIPVLALLTVLPMLGAIALWLLQPLRPYAQQLGLVFTSLVLLGSLALAGGFNYAQAGDYQYKLTYTWIPSIGVSWAQGVNAMGLAMVLLSATLTLIVFFASMRVGKEGYALATDWGYISLLLASLSFMILIFTARDVFLFYLTFEAMLIPVYFLIARYGHGPNQKWAAMKFLLYSLAGGLVMLIGVVGIWAYSPVRNSEKWYQLFLIENLEGVFIKVPGLEMFLFITFFIAFAVKAPMVPVHTWLADAAENAHPGTSTLLVGVLDKIGTFGMIAYCLVIFPGAAHRAAPTIIVLSVVSVIWGAFAALVQKDILRLVSFTSVSHFGLMVMAIFTGSTLALTGAMVYMVAHGLSIAGLFLSSGFLVERAGTQQIADFGGMQKQTPILAASFFIAGLAAIALPGLSGFVPEFMVFMGTFKTYTAAAVLCLISVVIGAVYILLPYQRMFTGPTPERLQTVKDLGQRERWAVVAPLIVLMLVLGLVPQILVGPLNQVSKTVNTIQTTATTQGEVK